MIVGDFVPGLHFVLNKENNENNQIILYLMRINVYDWNVVKTIIKSKCCLLIIEESIQTVLLIWSVLHHHNAIDESNIKYYMYT